MEVGEGGEDGAPFYEFPGVLDIEHLWSELGFHFEFLNYLNYCPDLPDLTDLIDFTDLSKKITFWIQQNVNQLKAVNKPNKKNGTRGVYAEEDEEDEETEETEERAVQG